MIKTWVLGLFLVFGSLAGVAAPADFAHSGKLVLLTTSQGADLPASALDTLQPGNQTRRADAYRVANRTVFASKRLVSGKQELSAYVREDVLGRHLTAR